MDWYATSLAWHITKEGVLDAREYLLAYMDLCSDLDAPELSAEVRLDEMDAACWDAVRRKAEQ